MNQLFFLSLFLLGFIGMLLNRNLIKLIIGFEIMEASVLLWFISFTNQGGNPPIYLLDKPDMVLNDPLPQALTLTAIVIAASNIALFLTLVIELSRYHKASDVDKIKGLRD